MAQSVEKTGKTVDEAVQEALMALGLTRDEVDVEVLEEPARGILGIVGQRPARVRVTARPESPAEAERPDGIGSRAEAGSSRAEAGSSVPGENRAEADKQCTEAADAVEVDVVERARTFLAELLEHMGFSHVSVTAKEGDGVLRLDVQGKGLGGLIGRRGVTLDAVQHLVNLVAGRLMRGVGRGTGEQEDRYRIIVDAEGYREKRARSLERLALAVAERVRREGRQATLEPMNPMERRIVHLAIQGCEGVTSYSEGDEPYRRVVIAPAGEERGVFGDGE